MAYHYIGLHIIISMHKIEDILPKLHKPPKLKPLLLSDIMTALVNQEQTVDHTPQYKLILGHRWANNQQQHQQREQQLQLPEFATQQCSHQEILDYHIKNKIYDTRPYEHMLAKVDKKIKVAMLGYDTKLKEGQDGIQSLMGSLGTGCDQIQESRRCLYKCKSKLKESYLKVGPALRKIANISKVIEILSVWGKSKIPYLFSIDVAHPYHYDIAEVLRLFEGAKLHLRASPAIETSASLKTILRSLEQKQKSMISNVYSAFVESVIKFVTPQQYRVKYSQYLVVCSQQLCPNLLTMQGIKQMIEENGKVIFQSTLARLASSFNLNVDMLNEVAFLQFYEVVMEQFVIYFSSWHRVTTYHIDNDTGHAALFLENRKQVFVNFSQRIANSIEESRKFMSLEYRIKLQLVERLQDFMEAGQKWMGTYENLLLPQIVVGKLSSELQGIFSLYNNLIKSILSQEISVSTLQAVDEARPYYPAKTSYHIPDINYSKVSAFLCARGVSKQYVDGIEKTYEKLQDPPMVRLKIGEVFTEMIGEYLERSKYIQVNKSIYLLKILDHFQFILFMFYQLCLRQGTKRKINTDVLAELAGSQKQRSEQTSIISLNKLNELAQINVMKHQYGQVLSFLASCGTKYDGIKIVGIIDVNKVYEAGSQSIQTAYFRIVCRVVAELAQILRWLVTVLPNTHLKGYRECGRIGKLEHILMGMFGLFLENSMESTSRKYTEAIAPMMLKLKWEVKKFNQETANLYKEYKLKVLQIFKKTSYTSIIKPECPELCDTVSNREVECLYRSMLECYGRIQKINDNGRQLIRLDCIEIGKMLNEVGVKCQVWIDWFDKYLDLTSERNYKVVVDKIATMGLFYDPVCWKYQLMWVVGDLSTREKKEYNSGIARVYMQFLKT